MPVRVTHILPGNAGVLQTVGRMQEIIRTEYPVVRDQAEAIALDVGVTSPWALALAVYHWVQTHMVYVHDGAAPDSVFLGKDVEELRHPDYLLWRIFNAGVAAGDCDCYVILVASLLRALAVPAFLVLTSGRPDQEFDHVFLKVQTESGPVYSDAIKGTPFGWHVPADRVTAMQEFPL